LNVFWFFSSGVEKSVERPLENHWRLVDGPIFRVTALQIKFIEVFQRVSNGHYQAYLQAIEEKGRKSEILSIQKVVRNYPIKP